MFFDRPEAETLGRDRYHAPRESAMLVNLLDAKPLGHWDISEHTSQFEFQFDSTLVYVQYSKGTSPKLALEVAQKNIQEAWNDMAGACLFAESWFRSKHPEFWRAWDTAKIFEHPLLVYSIHFLVDDNYPCYYIAREPCFEFERFIPDELDSWKEDKIRIELPYFPDTDAVAVHRTGKHQFEICKR